MTSCLAKGNTATVLHALLLPLLLIACSGEGVDLEGEHPIPRQPVALRLSLNHEARELLDPYTYQVYEEPRYEGEYLGYLGVVVVHDVRGSYSAYDMACPYCWPEWRRVVMDREGRKGLVVAECEVCHSVYDLALGLGHAIAGPSRYPLLSYRVVQNGAMLWVH